MRLGLRVGAAVLTTALLLCVGGCGDEADEGPLGASSEKSTETPSASATPDDTAPELPPATDNEKGRRAFATWFVQALAYGNRTNDPAPLTEKAIKDPELSCSVCASYETYLRERQADGITYQPSTYEVKQIFRTGKQQGIYVYDLLVSEPAGRDVKQDGTVEKRYPANPRQLIQVGFRFDDGGYQISGWKVGEGAQGSS